VDDVVCFNESQTDSDGDGLSDFCENNLAAAFAPELYYSYWDEVGREPYWVARPSDTRVMIGYFIAYYRDAGSDAYLCHLPGAPSSCNGHNGDSETIFLTVYYNEASQHWVLERALYSQHTSYGSYDRGSNSYPTMLTYPSHAGSYPRAYVSEGKHANYASTSECNGGGAFGTDTCTEVDTPAQVFVSGAYNVGSGGHHLLNCVESRDPSYIYYGAGRQECFWTGSDFRGWTPDSVGGASSSPYIDRLNYGGF